MNWEPIAAVGQLVAALGVIATLVYLAIQVRQNTAGIRGAAYQTWVGAITDWNMSIAAEPELARVVHQGHFDPAGLTDERAAMQYAMAMLGFMQVAQSTYHQFKDGLIDATLWNAELQRVAAHVAFPGCRQLWEAGLRTQLSPGFVEVVESSTFSGVAFDWKPEVGFISLEEPPHQVQGRL